MKSNLFVNLVQKVATLTLFGKWELALLKDMQCKNAPWDS